MLGSHQQNIQHTAYQDRLFFSKTLSLNTFLKKITKLNCPSVDKQPINPLRLFSDVNTITLS